MKSLKSDFPIFTYNTDLTYLDSAATSQKPQVVIDAMSEFYQTYNANIHRGLYAIAEKASTKVEHVRGKVQKFINAQYSDEIIFTSSTTEALNLIMYSWGRNEIHENDNLVTTIAEHHANFVPWQNLAKENKAHFKVIDITESGEFIESEILALTKDAKLFAFSYVSNVLGTITNVKKIIRSIREINKDIIIVVDGAQAAPHMHLDMQDLDCDFFVFSGHKMLAGTGIGVLYGKKYLLEQMPPFLFGGDMIKEVLVNSTTFAGLPNKFEAGTINIAGIISLGAAIDYIEGVGREKIMQLEKDLAAYCIAGLGKINGVNIICSDKNIDRSGIVSFTLDNIHAHDIAQVLSDIGVCVRSGHHCAMPLHKRLGIAASTRASFYLYNDEQDINRFIEGIKEVKRIF